MVQEEYAIYIEEVFKPSIEAESTRYVLENLWKEDKKFADSAEELGGIIFAEFEQNKKSSVPTSITDIAQDYLPPIRSGDGIMIVPRKLERQELRFVARAYAQKFKNH